MDRDQFDAITRLAWTATSRRVALGLLVGAALLGHYPAPAAAKLLAKRKSKKKRNKGKKPNGDVPCYPGTNCQPGQGRDNAGCDFSNSTRFFAGDFHGSDFGGANFTGAQLARAKLHGTDLSGACLVGANLQGAELDGADLDGAILCRTLMPDGTFDDSGCDRGTPCCPVPPPPACEECGDACGRPNDTCTPFFAPCCPRYICTPAVDPLVLTCQVPCAVDADCRFLGEGTKCQYDITMCTFMDRCCVVQ